MKYLLLLILFSFQLKAQDCQCADADLQSELSKSEIDKLINSTNKSCKVLGLIHLSDYQINQNELTIAEKTLISAEKAALNLDCKNHYLIEVYKNRAEIYYRNGHFGKAQDFSLKLLKESEKAQDYREIAGSLTMISQLLNQTGNADKGIIYARRAAKYLPKLSNPRHYADLLFKVMKRYLWHYQDIQVKGSLDTTEMYSYQLLEYAKKHQLNEYLSKAFINLEGVAYEKRDYKTALVMLDSSLKYSGNDMSDRATALYDKAEINMFLGDFKNATKNADSVIAYYKERKTIPYLADTYDLLSQIKYKAGDYREAFDLKNLSRSMLDSIRNVEQATKVAELERKFHQEKNEVIIRDLAKQRKIYLLIAIASILGLIAAFFFMRQMRLKNRQKIIDTEQRLNRARINPHFFFNALSSIQTYALQGHDGKSIATNISKFSHIMRETLENTYKDYVTVEQEIDFITQYLELQKMRFATKFEFNIHSSEKVDAEHVKVPSMLLQPFVENSIEHGLKDIDYKGLINITFEKAAENLVIKLTDNGKGLSMQYKTDHHNHISRASQITKDRIFLLNLTLKSKASFSIDNNQSGPGVLVTITLPYIS